MDPMTIGLLAGGGLGMLNAGKNQKKEAEQAAYRKAALKYSPWTGMGDPGALGLQTDPLASGLQGAATGAQVGGLFGGGAGATPGVAGAGMLPGVGQQQAPAPTGAAPSLGMGGSPGAYQGQRYGLIDPNSMYVA